MATIWFNQYETNCRSAKKQHDIKIDKRKMDLPHGIHALGYTNVPVKLDKEVEGTIRAHCRTII